MVLTTTRHRYEGGLQASRCDQGARARWLIGAYDLLNEHFGDLFWWPGDSPLEVVVGAILTQNTAWRNVERAILSLKERNLLSVEALLAVDDDSLADCIRPAGYFNVKTKRLKAFFRFLADRHEGSLENLFEGSTEPLREQLLSVYGIGEETADSILLYAANKPIFVVDAYTRRILARHGLVGEKARYGEIQALFMASIPADAPQYNQYHALIVETGKTYCTKKPRCNVCPLSFLNEMGSF